MASLILSTAGNAAFGPIGGFLGALAGTAIDNAAITALSPAREQPSRLSSLKLQASQEGAPIPIVYGRFRVTGQVIWASKFREISKKRIIGGKGGQRVVERSYSISFAIGLCEGVIDGLGRVWVNGDPLDLSTANYRLYLGDNTQLPDPVIEALEGLHEAPAFRGLAYIVFEDFPLDNYSDRIPQFGFEVMASPRSNNSTGPRLRDLAQAVCLIPGAGEFVYATTLQRKILDVGQEIGENLHVQSNRSDFDVSLDNLARDFPNVSNVSLVVAWFGTDLRAGHCQIMPKVEGATKKTRPRAWSVAGLTRANAAIISQSGGKPAYGGSPDDQSVIEGILALKSRGHRVTHNPFVMMDIAFDNNLPNPAGGNSQPPYPWRGRITCFPAIGQQGSVDATTTATTQIDAFFGTASASHFTIAGRTIAYIGPYEWSYRRFVLHQASLCVAAGGVDAFLIGSELIGLTRVRGAGGSFPAVSALISLAGEVRALLGPSVKISYGADWTEYGAYSAPGTNDLRFPLDPLWASSNIDFIGLDWYAPLSDRRDGEARPDLLALQGNVEGGEGYDFYYAGDAARLSKARTPILDGAYQEHWVWRQKDVRSFWSNQHFERVNGVRATTQTPWVAKSKPVAFMELGFPAVNKGANRPSVFPDPKSTESGLPPFSTGVRDDLEQSLALEATLSYWRDNNPASHLYVGKMLDMSRTHLWAWDARPFPHFPALTNVWADGDYAMLGHWLAGRSGTLRLSSIVTDVCARAGMPDVDSDAVSGYVDGFAIEAPTSARAVLENLFTAFGLEAHETAGHMIFTDTPPAIGQINIGAAQIIVQNAGLSQMRSSAPQAAPCAGRFTSFASERDYQPATQLTAMTGQNGPIISLASPLVLDPSTRQSIAERLARLPVMDGLNLTVAPSVAACLEVGDRFSVVDGSVWRVDRLAGRYALTVQASRAPDKIEPLSGSYVPQKPNLPILFSPPILVVLDLAAPFADTKNPKPLVGCACDVWPGMIDILLGEQVVGSVSTSMTVGALAENVGVGPVGRLIRRPFLVAIKFGAQLPQTGRAALLMNGIVADVISWRWATLTGIGTWQLGGWVRGLGGTSVGLELPLATQFVLLDDALTMISLDMSLIGSALEWSARPQVDIAQINYITARFDALARRPWSPCGVKAQRGSDGAHLTWVRRARGDGDAWSSANAPMGAVQEAYRLSILNGAGQALRTIVTTSPNYVYPSASELVDFGTRQSQLRVEIAQMGDDGLIGIPWAGTLGL